MNRYKLEYGLSKIELQDTYAETNDVVAFFPKTKESIAIKVRTFLNIKNDIELESFNKNKIQA